MDLVKVLGGDATKWMRRAQWALVAAAAMLAWTLMVLAAVWHGGYLVLFFPAGWCLYAALRQYRVLRGDFWGRYSMDKIFDDPAGWETQNLLTIGGLITRAALWREESRGVHARLDYPEPRDEFAVHDLWTRGSQSPRKCPVDHLREADIKA